MQMRNLLRLMGVLALTTGAATSVVACNNENPTTVNLDTVLKQNKLGEITVVDVTTPTVKELKDAIKAVKENKDINLDAITVKVITPKSGPIVSATVTPDGKIYNGNPITVTFTLVKVKTPTEVTTDIKTTLEKTGVDGSTLNDSQKQSDAKDLIKAAIKVVTDADKVGEATFSFTTPDTSLTVGENTVNIKVTFDTSKNVEIAVKLTGVVAQ